MNLFKQYYNQDVLKELLQDKIKLNQAINETGGYVLYLMEQNKMKPNLDLFFDNNDISAYALQFVLKNYTDFTTEQKRVLNNYQNQYKNYDHEKEEFKPSDDEPTFENHDIEYYLKNKLTPPKNSILTFELIKAYSKEISDILSNEDIVMERVLKTSMKPFTLKEVFAIDKKFIKKHPYILNYYPQYFENQEFKNYFKEIMLAPGQRVGVHNFEHYHFTEDDKELLYSLIGNRYRADYDDMLKLHGAKDIISKTDFFEKLNSNDITYFTDEETLENKELIQNRWLQGFDRNDKKDKTLFKYDYFSKLVSTDSNLSQFKIIVSPQYFASLVEKTDDVSLNSVYKEDTQTREKMAYFEKLSLNYLFENPKDYYKFRLSSILGKLFENYYSEEKQQLAQQFYEVVMPEAFKNDGFLHLSGRYNHIIDNHSIQFIDTLVKTHPSINLLYVLLDTYTNYSDDNRDNRKKELAKELKTHINNLIPLVNEEDAKTLVKAFNYKKPITTLYNNSVERQAFESNFLNHGYDLKMNESIKSLVLSIDKSMLTHILKENIQLDTEDYQRVLRNSKNDKDALNFITKYTQKNRDVILSNEELVREILAHPKAQNIIEIDNSKEEQKAYANYLVNYEKIFKLNKLSTKLKSDNDPEKEVIYEKKRTIEKEQEELTKKISLSFIQTKTEELIQSKDLKSLCALSSLRLFEYEKFNHFVYNASFKDTLQFVDNEYFMHIASSQMGYEDKSTFSFGKYSEKETYELATKVLPYIDIKEGKREKEKITRYFKNSNKEYLKDFFIDYLSNELFYSYRLKDSLNGAKFSNDEILKAYINAEKTNFFSDTDVNAGYSHVLRDFYEDDKEKYFDMLAKTKDAYPKLYLLLTHHEITNQFYDWGEGIVRDEAAMHFYIDTYDTNVILKGIDFILDEIKENRPPYNSKLAAHAVIQALYSTYYDKDTPNGREYYSLFSNEYIHELMTSVWHKAPLFILERHRMGEIDNIGEYIVQNMKDFDSEKMPLDFLYPNWNLKSDYFRVEADHTKASILTIFNGMMDYYIKSNQNEKLDYMIFLVERAKYFSDNINYHHHPENLSFDSCSNLVEVIFENDAIMDKIKNYKLKSMLDNTIEIQEIKPKKSKKI